MLGALLVSCNDSTPQEHEAQPSINAFPYRIELTSVGVVQDTLFDHFIPGLTRFRRTLSGAMLVGPMLRGGETALARLNADLSTAERQVRRGFGPGEASGWFVFGVAGNDALVIAAEELGLVQVLEPGGSLRFSAPMLRHLDGVGLCGDRVVMTGSAHLAGVLTSGVFAADSAQGEAELLHALRTDTTRRSVEPHVTLLSVRHDRALAGIPNRAEVAVSDSGCKTMRRVALPLPWFLPWSGNAGGVDLRPHVVEVQWHNDTSAFMVVVRANPAAGVSSGAGVTDAPKARVVKVPMFLTDLIAFHVHSGRILAHESVPLTPYMFTSADEVSVHDRLREATELFRLRLVRTK